MRERCEGRQIGRDCRNQLAQDAGLALRYLKANDYPDVARRTIREMQRQVGALKLDENGLACRGVLVRHLIMPGFVEDTEEILRFLAEKISPDTYVNLMDRYSPAWQESKSSFGEINRRIMREEYAEACRVAGEIGLWRLDERLATRSLLFR